MQEPTKLAFAGDWHANTDWARRMIAYAAENGVDTIVQAGDFGFTFSRNFLHGVRYALEEHNVNLYFVDGNHDDHSQLFKWGEDDDGFKIPPLGNYRERLHYIPRGHRWQWWGLTFMGLGGAHSVDRPWREPGKTWWSTELISEMTVRQIVDTPGTVDIMVTHDLYEDAPFPNNRKDSGWPFTELQMARGNRLAVQAVVDHVKPRVFIHGHYHTRYDRIHEGVHLIGLGMDATSPEENMLIVDAGAEALLP